MLVAEVNAAQQLSRLHKPRCTPPNFKLVQPKTLITIILLCTGVAASGKEDFLKLPKRCPPHQMLKDRKLLEWRSISFQSIVTGELKRSTAAISHVWLSKKHFDPDGLKLARLKEVLESEACRWIEYIWLDFICVPQPWNDEGVYEHFCKEDELIVKQAIEQCLPNLFLGATVVVLWDDGFDDKLWPAAELFVACKTPTILGLTPSLAEHHRPLFACMQSHEGQESKIQEQVLKAWAATTSAVAANLLTEEKFKATVARDKTVVTRLIKNMDETLAQLFREHPSLFTPRHAIAGLSCVKARCKLDFTIDVKHINRLLNRKTAIMLVAEYGLVDVLRLILSVPDIDVNAHDTSIGFTALLFATREGQGEALQLLLADARTDVNAKSDSGDTALTIALMSKKEHIAELLLAHPAIEIDMRSVRIAVESELEESLFAKMLRCPSLDINRDLSGAKCGVGFAPLHLAIQRNNTRMVRQILQTSGVDLNLRASRSRTPLHVAVEYGHASVAELLLSTPGIDLNACTSDGFSALALAAVNGQVQLIRMFLKMPGMNVDLKSVLALTLQQESKESEEIENSILAARAEVSLEAAKSFRAAVKKVQALREELVADLDFTGKLLRAATQEGDVELLELVLALPRVDVNLKCFFVEGTPLQYAAEKGRLEILKTLLKIPTIDVNANSSGWTALHAAAEHGHADVVEALLEAPGVDANIRSGFYTPLAIAEQTRQDQITALLRQGGGKRWSKSWVGP